MMAVALPAFLLAMYEKDGLPLEKVVRNIIRARFLRPGVRPYRTENIYAPFTHRGAAGKEDAIAESKKIKSAAPERPLTGKLRCSPSRRSLYLVMHPDGVCQLPGGLYTKTVEYEDINYSVASTEDQTAIFGGWSSFLNYFDTSLPFQLSFINRRSRSRSKYRVNIPQAEDSFNSIRAEFTGMLKTRSLGQTTGSSGQNISPLGSPPMGSGRPGPGWSVWRPM